ncbi:MAG: hypothetical protein AB7S26_10040 [Sandaracinaceae bacterium]
MPNPPTQPGEILVRAHTVGQLFQPLDPSPLEEKDLDAKVEDYIVSWAQELPTKASLSITLRLSEAALAEPQVASLERAFQAYFAGRADRLRAELRELFREGRRSLVVGLPVLTVSLLISQLVTQLAGPGTLTYLVGESLLILGWVANWRPLEIFLYAWWPIRRRLHLYRRLAVARVQVRSE